MKHVNVREDIVANFVASKTRFSHPVPLKETSYDISVVSGMAVVKQTRVFRNDEKRPIEATLTFPVPFGSALYSISADIDGRSLQGVAKAREEARDAYESAIDDGKPAVLHEELLPGLHMLSVANVAPGVEIKVTAAYSVALSLDDGFGRVRIPQTVGQIYGDLGLQESDSLIVGGPVGMTKVSIEGTGCFVNGSAVDGTIQLPNNVPIHLSVIRKPSDLKPVKAVSADGRKFTMTFEPAAKDASFLDIDLLLDTSGSMAIAAVAGGEGPVRKWDLVKQAVAKASKGLLAREDKVALWTFSNSCVKVGSSTGEDVEALVGAVDFEGLGTRLAEAVSKVASSRKEANVLLVTDGKSGSRIDIDTIVREGSRFTVVLVGEDALESRVGYLAAMTGGQMFVVDGANVGDAIAGAISSMRRVANPITTQTGRPVSFRHAVAGTDVCIEWSAKKDEGAASKRKDADRSAGALAACLALRCLPEDQAAAWAEEEGLVTHLTSIVLVDEAAEAVEGIPATRKVALPDSANEMFRSVAFMSAPAAISNPRMSLSASSAESAGAWGGLRSKTMGVVDQGQVTNIADDWIFKDARKMRQGVLMPTVPMPMIDDFPSLPKVGGVSNPNPGGRALSGMVDWDNSVDLVENDSVIGNDLELNVFVYELSLNDEVDKLAGYLGCSAVRVVIGLLAKRAEMGSRTAGRIARKILKDADPVVVDRTMKAIGL